MMESVRLTRLFTMELYSENGIMWPTVVTAPQDLYMSMVSSLGHMFQIIHSLLPTFGLLEWNMIPVQVPEIMRMPLLTNLEFGMLPDQLSKSNQLIAIK